MKKLLTATVVALSLAGAHAQETKVAIGISGWTGFAPLTLAKEAGIFKKHGLDVSIKKIPQKDRHLAIASGDVQCAATTVETWVVWNANGVATTQIFQLDKSYGADGMVVKPGITSIKDLKGKTVGIIGFGQMGSAFAEKLRGFGVRILGHDKYRSGFSRAGIEECSLEQVVRESDVISLHLPLNEETRHFANAAFFARTAKPIWFLNTSRGPVVDTAALLDALDHGRVIAAALDVLEFERPDLSGLDPSIDQTTYDRLQRHDRVLLTPHIAGVTHEGKFKMADVLATKILHLFPHGTT